MSERVDAGEIAKFEAMAAEWWAPDGPAAPLHRMNPCRLDYVRAQIAAQFDRDPRAPRPFAGLSLLDVGCAGGLVSEPMARLGMDVVGVDASGAGIAAARAHAALTGLEIDYREATAEDVVAEGRTFDVALALEVVEHVPQTGPFLATLACAVRPGGLAILSTLNRTPASFLKAIVGAEYVLGWLPRGTHDWRRFPTPGELADGLSKAGLTPVDRCGMAYAPMAREWSLDRRDLSVNYLMTAERPRF